MKTIPTEAIKPDAPSILLLLGLSTSLLSVGMGTLVPSFIQGGTLMLVAAGVIWSAVEPARQERNRSLAYWPILLVIAGVLPSLLNSTDLQTSQETLAFLPVAFAIFLAICMTNGSGRAVMAIASLTMVLLIGVDGTVQFISTNGYLPTRFENEDRIPFSLPHANDVSMLPILLPVACMGLMSLPRSATLAIGSIIVPLVVFTVMTSWSRHAWIGMTITAIGLAVWRGRLMRVSVGCGVIIAMLLVAMDVADVQSRLLSLAEPMRDDRIGLWLAGMTMFLEHPFTGTGAGTFGFSYPDVVSLLQLPDGYQAASGFVPVVHNVYLELLAEYGLPGFLAYAIVTSWLVGQLTSLAIFGSDGQSTHDSDDARRWAVALLISWSSMLVMAMFDLSFTSFRFTYVYWMIVGLSFSIIIRSAKMIEPPHGHAQSPTTP